MENITKKILSFAMIFLLALALIPISGLNVVDVKADVDPAKAACVDQVTGKYFNTVQDAVDYFNENDGSPKLKLLRDTAEQVPAK